MNWLAAAEKTSDALYGGRVMRVVGLNTAKQDIGIDKNAHLAASVIEALTAHGFIRQRWRVRHSLSRLAPQEGPFGRRQRLEFSLGHLLFKQMLQVDR